MIGVGLADLLECASLRWSPAIGDPTPWGWGTVVVYAGAAILSASAAGVLRGRERAFWTLLAGLLIALAVNKQLDMQSALTAMGRCVAQANGWYDARRAVQAAFVIALIGASIAATLCILVAMRRHLAKIGPAILGISFVCAFVAIRAVGFHHLDGVWNMRPLGGALAGVRVNILMEWPGPLLIAANALSRTRAGIRLTRVRGHASSPARRSAGR